VQGSKVTFGRPLDFVYWLSCEGGCRLDAVSVGYAGVLIAADVLAAPCVELVGVPVEELQAASVETATAETPNW